MAGVAGAEAAERLGLAAVGQRATRFGHGDEHLLVGTEHLGRLGHEMYAREENCAGLHLLRLDRQCERVAQKIGDGLHFGQRIIVREDHGSLAAFELFDAGEEVIDHLLFLFFNSILI